MSQGTLEEAAKAVVAFAMSAGISESDLGGVEESDRLAYQVNLPASRLDDLKEPVWRPLVSAWGDALTLRFLVGERRLLEIDTGTSQSTIEGAKSDLSGAHEVTLDLTLRKDELLRRLKVGGHQAQVALYLYPRALLAALREPLDKLEGDVLGRYAHADRLILLVPLATIHLSGDYLAVLGGAATDRWESVLQAEPRGGGRARSMRELAPDAVNWLGFNLKALTPLHLMVQRRDPRLDANGASIACALFDRLTILSLAYTATQVRAPGEPAGSWIAAYTVDRYRAELTWSGAGRAATLTEIEGAALSLGDLAAWAYEEERSARDRLTVVRTEVARSLESQAPAVEVGRLLPLAETLGKRVRAAWESFIQGKLELYYARVREVEEAVDETAKAAREQVKALSKSLTESALAAVGVIVGSFLAAVFKDKVNPDVFRLGLRAYAVYLFVFPGIIGLSSNMLQLREILGGFAKREEAFKQRLDVAEVERIVGESLREGTCHYWVWFTVSCLAYLLMILLLIYATIWVPHLL